MKKLILLFGLILILISYCTLDFPDDPKPPKWDVEIERIPLFKADTLRLGDQFDPETFKRSDDADSILAISISDLQNFDLKDKLKIQSQQVNFSDQVGVFEVDVEQSKEAQIDLNDLYPGLDHYKGGNHVVPATEILSTEEQIEFDDFKYISIVSGRVEMKVINHLGFPLDGDVKMDLIDVGRGMVVIDTLQLGRIEHGETGIYYVDLAGEIISNKLKAVLHGSMTGSEGRTVHIPTDSGIDIVVTTEKFTANEASAKIPGQTFELSGSVDINSDSLKIRHAKIETGSINIKVNNQFDFNIDLEIKISNLLNEQNNEITTFLPITAYQTGETLISLDKTNIDLDNKDMNFNINLSIHPESETFYTLKSSDEIAVDIDISEIQFESVTGDFSIRTEFPQITETIIEDMPDQLDNLGFKDVVFYMSFINNPFDLDLDVKIKAVRGDVNNQLPIIKKITKNSSLILDRNGINNDYSTPTILDIVNMIPEKIIMDGKVTVKGENVTFDKDDQIGVQYGIDFPLRFSTNSASYSQKDSLKIDNDMRDFLKNKCRSAGILLTVENSLPISGMLSLLVGPDSTNITTELFSIGLPTSTVFDGIVAQPGDSTFNVNLDEVKFTTIADGYFYKFIVAIDDVEEAALTANDYIIIKDVYISGKFLFDPDGE